jgi:hypothetical protein
MRNDRCNTPYISMHDFKSKELVVYSIRLDLIASNSPLNFIKNWSCLLVSCTLWITISPSGGTLAYTISVYSYFLNIAVSTCIILSISAQKTFNKKRPKKSRYNSPSHHVTQRIAKIKLKFLSPRVEKSKENSLVFLLNMNNSLDLHKIN